MPVIYLPEYPPCNRLIQHQLILLKPIHNRLLEEEELTLVNLPVRQVLPQPEEIELKLINFLKPSP